MFAFIDKEQTISVNTDTVNSVSYYWNNGLVYAEVVYTSGKISEYETTFTTTTHAARLFQQQTNKSKDD